MTCIFLGKDSIACYFGDSAVSDQVLRGNASDARFFAVVTSRAYVFMKADPGFTIFLKPTVATGALKNLSDFKTNLRNQGVNQTIIDTLSTKEIVFFHATSLTDIFNSTPTPFQLPADTDGTDSFPNNPDRLVVLIYNEKGIYAYRGTDLAAGKKYTYPEFKNVLKSLNSDGKLAVLIRPSKKSTYKNTVNMLDLMTVAKVRHYGLVDITRREESFLEPFSRSEGVPM